MKTYAGESDQEIKIACIVESEKERNLDWHEICETIYKGIYKII